MLRDINWLANDEYDLLVIGGGISGACIAWDAALRGLRVALVEKGDFGAATSANSLKTIHGGLRYLQDGSPRLVRKMMRERKAFLQIAPHLVHPLPVIMPTYKNKLSRSKLVLGTAVKLNDLISLDRNRGIEPSNRLPNGRILTRRQIQQLLPGLQNRQISGGVLWFDAQMADSDRLLHAFLHSAALAGAQIASHVTVNDFLRQDERVAGVTATDTISGQAIQIRASMVVNAAGPWIDEVLKKLNVPIRTKFHLSGAMNLVTRQILPDYAVGLTSSYTVTNPDGTAEKRSRVLFIAPWQDYSLVGTIHLPFNGRPDDQWVTEEIIAEFIAEINRAYPPARLERQDVCQVHSGFLPAVPQKNHPAVVRLVREAQIFDHAAENGIEGLITAMGVKFTTARYLAEKTVDLVFRKLKQPSPPCQTRTTRLADEQSGLISPVTAGTAVNRSQHE